MQKGAELGQSLFGTLAKHQQNILPKIDHQQFTQLLKEGKAEQALNLLCQEQFLEPARRSLPRLKPRISEDGAALLVALSTPDLP